MKSFDILNGDTYDIIETIQAPDMATATTMANERHQIEVIVRETKVAAAPAPTAPAPTQTAVVTVTKVKNVCWCGCGGLTGGKFVPGHDARFHGLAKRVGRGEAQRPAHFVSADAEADFDKWVVKGVLTPKVKSAPKVELIPTIWGEVPVDAEPVNAV